MEFNLKKEVNKPIKEIGMSANIKGYHYAREAIIAVTRKPETIKLSFDSQVYLPIAAKYKTSVECVERNIRHAIMLACKNGGADAIQQSFGHAISPGKSRPTNTQFISTIADVLRLQSRDKAKQENSRHVS